MQIKGRYVFVTMLDSLHSLLKHDDSDASNQTIFLEVIQTGIKMGALQFDASSFRSFIVLLIQQEKPEYLRLLLNATISSIDVSSISSSSSIDVKISDIPAKFLFEPALRIKNLKILQLLVSAGAQLVLEASNGLLNIMNDRGSLPCIL